MNKITCDLCPHLCQLKDGQAGYCGARSNQKGEIISLSYGKWLSLALDPIEKKPLARFKPGSNILSLGTFGCNMACPFCQNYELARAKPGDYPARKLGPEELVHLAEELKSHGNIGLAFTYNEPLTNYECLLDTAILARKAGLETVVVTNGQINEPYLLKLLPYISAWNIDLKAFSQEAYQSLGGDFHTTLRTIQLTSPTSHVEITSLIVPKISDDLDLFKQQIDFLASISPNLPLHLSRYHPAYKYNEPPTDKKLMFEMLELAKAKLNYVYLGNVY